MFSSVQLFDPAVWRTGQTTAPTLHVSGAGSSTLPSVRFRLELRGTTEKYWWTLDCDPMSKTRVEYIRRQWQGLIWLVSRGAKGTTEWSAQVLLLIFPLPLWVTVSLGLGDEPVYISSASLFFFLLGFKKLCRRWGSGGCVGGRQLRSITLVCGIILWLRVRARTCATGKHTFTYRFGSKAAHTRCVFTYLRTSCGMFSNRPCPSHCLMGIKPFFFPPSRTNTRKRQCVFSMGHPVSQRGATGKSFSSDFQVPTRPMKRIHFRETPRAYRRFERASERAPSPARFSLALLQRAATGRESREADPDRSPLAPPCWRLCARRRTNSVGEGSVWTLPL